MIYYIKVYYINNNNNTIMSNIKKIAKSRKILKEILSSEWNTEDMPILSEEELRKLLQ